MPCQTIKGIAACNMFEQKDKAGLSNLDILSIFVFPEVPMATDNHEAINNRQKAAHLLLCYSARSVPCLLGLI